MNRACGVETIAEVYERLIPGLELPRATDPDELRSTGAYSSRLALDCSWGHQRHRTPFGMVNCRERAGEIAG